MDEKIGHITPNSDVDKQDEVLIFHARDRSLSLSSFQGNIGAALKYSDEEEDSLSCQLSETADDDHYQDFIDDSDILSENHMSANFAVAKSRARGYSNSSHHVRKSSISQFQAVFDDLPETDAKKFFLLKQEIETLMAEKAMYRSNYEEICASIEQLQDENETLQDTVQRLKGENRTFKEISRSHSIHMQKQLNMQQNESSDNLASKDQMIKNLKKQRQNLETELDFERQKLTRVQKDLSRRDMLCDNMKKQLRDKQGQIDELKKKARDDVKLIKDLKETLQSLRSGRIKIGEFSKEEPEVVEHRYVEERTRSTDAVVGMLREEIRQRDDLINSVNEDCQESRHLLAESMQYLDKLLKSLCVSPEDSSKYNEKTYQRLRNAAMFLRSLRIFLRDESDSMGGSSEPNVEFYKSSRNESLDVMSPREIEKRKKQKRSQVTFDTGVSVIMRNPLTKEMKQILAAPRLPTLTDSDRAKFEMKGEDDETVNLYDITCELKNENEELFEVFVEEWVMGLEEKSGPILESTSKEAQEAYERCVHLVEKMTFSEEQRKMLMSSSDGSLPILKDHDVQTFNIKGDNDEDETDPNDSYNFYDELKKLEGFDDKLFDVFMEEHIVASPKKPVLKAKMDMQNETRRADPGLEIKMPPPKPNPMSETAKMKILEEKRKKKIVDKENRLMDLCKKIAHKIILDPEKRVLLEPINGELPNISEEQKALLTAISKDKKEYNLYEHGMQLHELNPELYMTFLEGATIKPSAKKKKQVSYPKAQSVLIRSPNQKLQPQMVVQSAQVIHTGVTRNEARRAVKTFFTLYADPENWRYSSQAKTTLYQFVFHNEVIECRFSFLYPLVIYLGQIIGVNKRCISYAALLAYGRANKVISLSREMKTMIQTIEYHNNHHLWDYVFAILENAFKFHNQCYVIIGSRTSVSRR